MSFSSVIFQERKDVFFRAVDIVEFGTPAFIFLHRRNIGAVIETKMRHRAFARRGFRRRIHLGR